jgi:hypothetical protein
MTEQIPTTSSAHREERKLNPQASKVVPTALDQTQRHLRTGGRFGERDLRWPERSANAFATPVADPELTRLGSSRDRLRWLLTVDAPSRHGWSVPAIRRRPVISRGPGPPTND